MQATRDDAAAARGLLQAQGWIPRRAEAFRHLPPPDAAAWMGPVGRDDGAHDDGWTLEGIAPQAVQWIDMQDARQRAAFTALLPPMREDEAAPFTWAHRTLVRRALHVRIDAADAPVVLRVHRRACHTVEAPLLLVELLPGARCALLETHDLQAGQPLTQNLQVHVRLHAGAQLQHLRHVAPGAGQRVAHHLHAVIDKGAGYEQASLLAGAGYHLQRSVLELAGDGASARGGSVLLCAGDTLDRQVLARHAAPRTRSTSRVLALASGAAKAVANAHTFIAAGSRDAVARQKLVGIPTAGQPRVVLRPHLEILHDQVQASHGATWGALPEDALFLARQRGIAQRQAQALILQGMALATLADGGEAPEFPESFGMEARVAAAVQEHLATSEARHG